MAQHLTAVLASRELARDAPPDHGREPAVVPRQEDARLAGRRTRILGFVPAAGAAALLAPLNAVEGPPLIMREGAGIAALLQAEPTPLLRQMNRAGLLASLHTVQRRLEVACLAGPCLAVDPSASCCPSDAVASVLDPAWQSVAVALAQIGCRHQWEVTLRWTPEWVLARHRDAIRADAAGLGREGLADVIAAVLRAERARREAALVAVLSGAVLAFAPSGPATTETEIALTVLVASDGEAAVEAALEGLGEDVVAAAAINLRGPLPPLSFTAARVAELRAADVARAWRILELGRRIDAAGLQQQWRRKAFALHPDRNTPEKAADFASALSDVTDACHLLRDLIGRPTPGEAAGGAFWTLDTLSRRAGYRLVLPADGGAALPEPGANSGAGEPQMAP